MKLVHFSTSSDEGSELLHLFLVLGSIFSAEGVQISVQRAGRNQNRSPVFDTLSSFSCLTHMSWRGLVRRKSMKQQGAQDRALEWESGDAADAIEDFKRNKIHSGILAKVIYFAHSARVNVIPVRSRPTCFVILSGCRRFQSLAYSSFGRCVPHTLQENIRCLQTNAFLRQGVVTLKNVQQNSKSSIAHIPFARTLVLILWLWGNRIIL